MTFTTPGGIPARSASSASASAENGVWEAGRMTTGQPAARAGAHLRVIIAAGKFHGVIEATTPIGCFSTDDAPARQRMVDDVAVDALRLLGEPLDERRRVGDLAARLGQGLPLLGRHQHREVFLIRHHSSSKPAAHQPGAIPSRDASASRLHAASAASMAAPGLLAAEGGDGADDLARSGVVHLHHLSASRIGPTRRSRSTAGGRGRDRRAQSSSCHPWSSLLRYLRAGICAVERAMQDSVRAQTPDAPARARIALVTGHWTTRLSGLAVRTAASPIV